MTAHPVRCIQRTYVVDDLGLHIITIIASQLTAYACRVGLALIIVKIGVDHQCSDDTVSFYACIRVECQTQMQRYTQTRLLRVDLTTTSEVVYPHTTTAVVVGVIVATIGIVVDAIRNTRVLHPVACCFQITCHTASLSPLLVGQQLCTIYLCFTQLDILRGWSILHFVGLWIPSYITYTATKFHSISGDYRIAFACVAEGYIVIVAVRIKSKSTEIYPSATSHLLVDLKLGLLSTVYNGIFGCCGAIRQTLIGYIYGILACWQWVRGVAQFAYFFAAHWRKHISSFLKWILAF